MSIRWNWNPIKALFDILIMALLGLGIFFITGNNSSWYASVCLYMALEFYRGKIKLEIQDAI